MKYEKLTDEELKKAFFILRHGSSEGLSAYVKAVLAIEGEYDCQKAEINRLKVENECLKMEKEQLENDNINLNMNLEHITAELDQARKETAKEILQALLDFVNCEKINQGHSFEKIKEILIKVAKTYEVEVEE